MAKDEIRAAGTAPAAVAESTANADAAAPLRGRSVFMVETVPAGVAVRPAFLAEDGRLLDMPAVFPDLTYALSQIDELKQLVTAHFAQAAQVGMQVIAAQAASAAAQPAPPEGTGVVSTSNLGAASTGPALQKSAKDAGL